MKNYDNLEGRNPQDETTCKNEPNLLSEHIGNADDFVTKKQELDKEREIQMDNSKHQDRQNELNTGSNLNLPSAGDDGIDVSIHKNNESEDQTIMSTTNVTNVDQPSVLGAETVPQADEPVKRKRRGRPKKSESPAKDDGFKRQFELPGSVAPAFPSISKVNIAELRLTGDFSSEIEVTQVRPGYEIRKPKSQEFVRIHPGEHYQITVGVMRQKLNMGENIWVTTNTTANEFPTEVVPANLRLAVNHSNQYFLWLLYLPKNGNTNPWYATALQAAERAKTTWLRVVTDMNLGQYGIYEAKKNFFKPVWPEFGFEEILESAFVGRIIDSLDHPYLRQLRGEE